MNEQQKRCLVILGNGPTMDQGVKIAEEKKCECWGINYQLHPQVTLLFQVHGDLYIKARFLDHLRKCPPKVPLMMHHRWSELPTSTPFPMKQYRERFQMRPYHACTMSYMLALAIMMGHYNLIHMYGVDFYYEIRHEAVYERPCVEWYMGYASACGIKFDLPAGSRLMTTCDNIRQVYGLEYNPALSEQEMDAVTKLGDTA